MSLRNLVTGSDVCAPSNSQQRSNAVGSLAETLLQRTRANERARQGGATSSNVQNFFENALTQEEREKGVHDAMVEDRARRHEVSDADRQSEKEWMVQEGKGQAMLPRSLQDFHNIFSDITTSQGAESSDQTRLFSEAFRQTTHLPFDVGERDRALTDAFQSFMRCTRSDVPFEAVPFPDHLWFDPTEQQKVAARVQHLCRVLFVDHGPHVADMQASRFLEYLHIGPVTSPSEAFHQSWDASKALDSRKQHQPMLSSNWMDQFSKLYVDYGVPRQDLVSQKQQPQTRTSVSTSAQDTKEAKDVSSALIRQMENDPDPKFQRSKFLHFVQKLNSGALVIEGDQVKEGNVTEQWATEFASQYARGQEQHGAEGQMQGPLAWEDIFRNAATGEESQQTDAGVLEGGWLDNSEIQEWMESYRQMAYGPIDDEDREYIFSTGNPFLGNPETLALASDLFARGNLSEAVLATEAEVQRNAENIDAWILLGKIHAENDNDPQAIAALNRARTIDPSNLTVLLDLGVCHANELHEAKTIEAVMSWLHQHPLYQSHPALATRPQDPSQAMSHAMNVFHRILPESSSDADVHVALGVLHHLGRNFEEAISLFHSAVQLRPDDYSLWNKLGATQANAARSGDAIVAYQKALEKKPNYMRGWANLGISYANLGDYAASVHHYVRALSLNPNAETVWGYLKSSAICAGFTDVLSAIEGRQLNVLKSRFWQT